MNKFRTAKAFVKRGVSSKKQGLIYYTCVNSDGDKALQDKIKRLCAEVANGNSDALYEFLTDVSVTSNYICTKYGVSHKSLYTMQRTFYML